jgi:hypothetical protein
MFVCLTKRPLSPTFSLPPVVVSEREQAMACALTSLFSPMNHVFSVVSWVGEVHVNLSESTFIGEANANDTPTAATEIRTETEKRIGTRKKCVYLQVVKGRRNEAHSRR